MPDTVLKVELVDASELPQEQDWALVRKPRDGSDPPHKWLFIKRNALPMALIDAAAALGQTHHYWR